jgi:hypothetical protein
MKTLIIFMFFSAQAFAQGEKCNTDKNIGQVKQIMEKLEWWAASDSQILNAPCTRDKAFTSEEMLTWLNAHPSKEKKTSEKFNGLTITDEDPNLINALKDLLTTKDFMGRPDKTQKTFTSTCKKVLCAAQEIFGKKEGLQLLFMHERFGFNGAVYQDPKNSSAWKASELDQVLIGLSYFPDNTLPADRNAELTHFKRGYTYAFYGPGVVANASVEVFDEWNTLSVASKRSTLVHEVGHRMAGKMDADESPEWLAMSGWTKKTDPKTKEETWKSSKPSALVSEYGKTNPAEDFAECVVAYRFNPSKLKKASPEKYAFMKNTLFDGLEYTNSETCSQKNSKSQARSNQAKSRMSALEKNPSSIGGTAEFRTAEKSCAESMFNTLSEKTTTSNNSFNQCIEKALSSSVCSEIAKKEQNSYSTFEQKLLKHQASSCPSASAELTKATVKQAKSNMKKSLLQGVTQISKDAYQNDCSSFEIITKGFYENKKDPYSPSTRYGLANQYTNFNIDQDIGKFSKQVCYKIKADRNKLSNWWDGEFSEEEIKNAVNGLLPN